MQDTRGQAGWDRRCDRHHVTGRSYPACPMCSQLVTRDTRACVSKPGICPSIGIYTHPSASVTTCLQHTATDPSIAIYRHRSPHLTHIAMTCPATHRHLSAHHTDGWVGAVASEATCNSSVCGAQVLKKLGSGFDSSFTPGHNLLCLLALYVGFHIFAFLALRRIMVVRCDMCP